MSQRRGALTLAVFTVVATLLGMFSASSARAAQAPRGRATTSPAQDWPMFLHDAARSSASSESILSSTNAGSLTRAWSFATGGSVVDSAAIVGGIAYVGSWDGYEYAINATTGAQIWKTNLGTTTNPNCTYPVTAGITSAATVINGTLYVGGGNAYWYALNAANGAVQWSVFTGDNSPAGGHYNWSSPLIYNGNAYIGIASNCDNPLVQGQLMEVNLTSHQVTHVANFVPDTQIGGGVWTSPTLDAATNTVFVSTGTINQYTQTQAQAIVALNATDLSLKGSWQLPFEAETYDSDWGTTPTLTSDASGRQLLSVANKNGILYTFNRNNISAGPVWQTVIAPGGDCPTCGDGTISSGAFVNSLTVSTGGGTYTGPVLFYATGNTMINGNGFQGAVRAFNPTDGSILWAHTTNGPIVAALAYDNGLLAYGQGSTFEVLNAANGQSVYDYFIGRPVYGAASFSGGFIYVGDVDNNLYAFGLGSTQAVAADANCPAGFTCQDIGNPQVKGSETFNSNGTITVNGAGPGARLSADQMRIITKPVTGDFQITVKDINQTGGAVHGYIAPQTGIMIRESNLPGSPFYAVLQDPTYPAENETVANLIVFYRQQWNAPTSELDQMYPAAFPRWVSIQRHGDSFQTLTSTDGSNYHLVPGTIHTLVMPTTVMGGLGVASGDSSVNSTATFSGLTYGAPTQTFTQFATNHPCPGGWSCYGVNSPNPPGDQTLNNGTFTMYGSGPGITSGNTTGYGHEDTFHYVYQSVNNDQTLSARFAGYSGSGLPSGAQSGIMMRASTDSHAPYYAILMAPGGGGVVEWRVNPNIVARAAFLPQHSWTAPIWLRIIRYTDTRFSPAPVYYSAAYSSDGTTWTSVLGSTVAIDLGGGSAGPTLTGMAASSNAVNVIVQSSFTNVSIAPTAAAPPGICPVGWSCDDVGTGHPAGNQTFLNHAFTVQATGDIWDVYDKFRYLHMPFSDGTVSARVVSVQNGGEWEKSGVMIRSSASAQGALDPQAPYYGVFLTPQHGVIVQWRSTQAGATNQIVTGVAQSTPVYVMASHYTDTVHNLVYYSGYTSTDNTNWTLVPGSTIQLALPLDANNKLSAGLAATSYQSNLATTTFDNWASLGSAPAPPGICSSQWNCNDIGGALPAGTQNLSGGVWTLGSGGADIWTTSDQFHYMWQPLAADGTVTARVTGVTGNAGPWAKGGVMLRGSSDPGAPYFGLFVTPGNGTVVQWRAAQGASSNQIEIPGTAPRYLRVIRWTNSSVSPAVTYYQAQTSPDGATWTAVAGSLMTVPNLTGSLQAGLASDSYNQGSGATWTMDNVAVSAGEVLPQGVCPNAWTCEDVGGSSPPGGQNLSGSNWSVQGGGYDIWNATDQFRFVWQPLSADGTVSARITAQGNTDPWAKAGVMLRLSDQDPTSPYYAALMTPGHGVAVQWRAQTNAGSNQVAISGGLPQYLQVSRWTDRSVPGSPVTYFTAYTSSDGVTWSAVPGSTVVIAAMTNASLAAGMAVTSHDGSNLSTAAFDSVAITAQELQPAGVCPAAYTCTDIGGPTTAGSQDITGSSATVRSSGSDIWGTSDQFRFVALAAPMTADGSISARLASQSAASPWAKSGVMLRASNAAADPYYAVLVTPGNGIVVQYRSASGGASVQLATVAGSAPVYVQITRAGTTYSAATSTDGITWTAVAGSSVTLANLAGGLLPGLAVTSHDGTLNAAVFTAVNL